MLVAYAYVGEHALLYSDENWVLGKVQEAQIDGRPAIHNDQLLG